MVKVPALDKPNKIKGVIPIIFIIQSILNSLFLKIFIDNRLIIISN